ncbi:molybdopterin-dependent oxidoreductase [Cryptosporangium aurantiacum]|uniref:Anaerobic selenocysteine-containing dehydrogenase n=1 Tax=Cryptosporangium aurantiacum TaxID=134849 RepID=A0A1M7JMJ0_9ACTN|nr:molybdopterin-dependent oxidoreductase [Cryptosporangium aurantiacum]SHM54125.1 Anaerobic selenocysteine-containing dehydrogenase [Cryptosporangium aurantiacum]
MSTRTAYRTCPLCEAVCGLEITLSGRDVVRVRGDRDDVFSRGFICPKGATLGDLDQDPDRLTGPLVRRDGVLTPATWDEAFAAVEAGLGRVAAEHGRESVALYFGNPNAHTLGGGLYLGALRKAIGTRNVYSAASVDQLPKHVSAGLMFGDPTAIPVPDLDRTDYLLMLGANPVESNGSLCTAPDFPGRLKALRARGGRLVVVDPRRTRTAALADRHLFIRPGTDPYLLLGIVHTLFAENLVAALDDRFAGVEELRVLAKEFTPSAMADVCGVPAEEIETLARELAAAETAVVYGRIGTSTAEFGTLTSWLVDVVTTLTGNLDRPGGGMFGAPPHGRTRWRKPFRTGRWSSRVRGLPEVIGELPVATLADEIRTPGDGQVRALVTVAGNPVLSTPDGPGLDAALETLDFMVSVDPYLNATTRRADVILPPPRILEAGHYDVALLGFAVRRVARYSPPVLAPLDGRPNEAQILAKLALIAAGQGVDADPALLDEGLIGAALAHAVADPTSPVHGRDAGELAAELTGADGTERRLDLMLRLGSYGDAFGARPGGLSLRRLLDAPHGLDLGPLEPALDALVATASGKVELAPAPIVADLARLRSGAGARRDGFVLVGRRNLRTNNSWSHNVRALAGGSNRCTLQMNTDDAARLGLAAGQEVWVRSRVGAVATVLEPSETIMPGVVSLPHGFGHGLPGTRQRVAEQTSGVNANTLTDPDLLDALSGTAVLNGIPVEVGAN